MNRNIAVAAHVALAAMLARGFHFDAEGVAAPPPADPVKARREEFSRIRQEAMTVVETAAKEDRDLTDDEKKANEQRFKRMEQIEKLDAEHARFAGMAIRGGAAAANVPGTVQTTTQPRGREEFEAGEGRDFFTAGAGETEVDVIRRHREAINHFIRTGERQGSIAGRRFTLTTGSGSGVLLPTLVGPPIAIKRMRNPIRAALAARGLQVIRTPGMEAMSIPVFDDTANEASVIAQDSTSENNLDPTVTGLTLGADLYDSGTVWSSNTLLNSLTYDLIAWLEPMLRARIEAKQMTAWFDDLDAATVGKTTASTTGVTYGELLDWQHSIPASRRGDGVFFVSDGLMRAIRGLVDANDNPIYQVSLRDEQPDTLLGWPVFVTDDLAAPAAGAVSGVAASAESLIVRDVTGGEGGVRIARYTNIPTHPDQFGLRMFANGDFAFQTGGVRTLKHAAA